ncbi:protein RRP6-like 3 isoform X2 [Ananas comosus]|uniref:Protein RRP6-like 3 isoform X2 n=1 Tax=Ananas comosus TaxID=4615 RepID=A0A6P5FPS9_ANACO|nr:protein RRP6-like 3 isoform X2 [Ananas comosus]
MASRERTIRVAIVAAAAISLVASAALLLLRQRRLRRRRRRGVACGGGGRRRRRCFEPEEKPQNRFKRVLADNSYSPFKHLKCEGKEKGVSLKMHPYEEEINSLLDDPPLISNFCSNNKYSDMSTSYSWIDTEAQLESLTKLLSGERVFAVDTEQHSLRSFLGYTALMQISTQKEDFLIDTIALHDVMGILRPVFADRSICKVFHGADNDVLWLQRDFHIYVVNMFDTAKACEILSKPYKSLAYLLETYCGVSTDKTFQREDWRVRPLSTEMIEYARSDAHYLLYISDCLASELHKRICDTSDCPDDKFNFFFEASRRANMVCMQLYVKDNESTPGASAAASIFSRYMNVQGFESLKLGESKDLIWKLCAWRDLMARVHDESLRFVLSDQAIAALAVTIPKSSTEVYNVIVEADLSNGSAYPSQPSPSPVVVTHVEELCCLLQDSTTNIDNVFKLLLDKNLGQTGCCPLSVYNYALVSEFNLKKTSMFSLKHGGEKLTPTNNKKASRELFIQKFSCKSPVYHNCRIYATDGRLLCYCDRRKLEWYLQRNLAKMVEEDPPAIMLLFEPKGRPEDEDNDFYIHSKKNICVGCGEKSHYIRYRIIPSCYRMHFPEHLKSHRSHDIVLLCVDCHEAAHAAAEKYKKQIAGEFGIPLFVQRIVGSGDKPIITVSSSIDGKDDDTGVSPLQLRTAAMALLRHGSSMPLERQAELMQIVKAYYGGREVTPEDLEMALFVGMSPHERRRFEKKKGLSFLNPEKRTISKVMVVRGIYLPLMKMLIEDNLLRRETIAL